MKWKEANQKARKKHGRFSEEKRQQKQKISSDKYAWRLWVLD